MVELTREQLEERLAALHQASLELVRDLSRNAVLDRIIHLAREQAGARYAALGMVNEQGELGLLEVDIVRHIVSLHCFWVKGQSPMRCGS